MSLPHLDRLTFLGTSFRQVGFDRLGDLVLPSDDERALSALAAALNADELVYLATCNRVECYALTRAALPPADLKRGLVAFFNRRGAHLDPSELTCLQGPRAAQHLFDMTASLDSLVVGESEVSGQARRALDRSLCVGLAGAGLRDLFERAHTCHRRVRTETRLAQLSASIGALAVRKIKHHFGPLGPRVSVILGVGPMSFKAARALSQTDGERLFVNRTKRGADELAQRFGGSSLSLEEFLSRPPARIDLLFTATSSPAPVISRAALATAAAAATPDRPLVVCDLGVPADVDPSLGSVPGVRLVTMVEIELLARQNESLRSQELAAARRVVARELKRLIREGQFREQAEADAKALLDTSLSHLNTEAQALLLSFSRGLASRFARQPRQLEQEVLPCSR